MVTAVQTGNHITFLIVSELYANKGIVNAAENDRFVFEVRVDFFNAQSQAFISGTAPQEFGVPSLPRLQAISCACKGKPGSEPVRFTGSASIPI